MRIAGILLVILLLGTTVGPFVWWITASADGPTAADVSVAISDLFARQSAALALGRSVVFALFVSTIQIVAGLGLGLLCARTQRPSAIVVLLLMPLSLSGLATSLTWKALLVPEDGAVALGFGCFGADVPPLLSDRPLFADDLPISYGDLALILIDSWTWVPVLGAFFAICLARIPRHLIESASLEGATPVYRAWRIELPYIGAYIAMAFLIRAADLFRMFDAPWGLFRDSPVITFFSTRVFGTAVVTRDVAACLVLTFAGLLVAIPAYAIATRVLRTVISQVLHEE